MSNTVTLDLDSLDRPSTTEGQPTYWTAENHAEDNYLRAEHWMDDVKDLMFDGKRGVVPMSRAHAIALLRWREEQKMYANLRDHDRRQRGEASEPESMLDAGWLDERWAASMADWQAAPETSNRRRWLAALNDLTSKLDAALAALELPPRARAFAKLSVRSPKDSAFNLSVLDAHMRAEIEAEAPRVPAGSAEALSADVLALRRATWRALSVATGAEALQLLLRSDRIYIDVLQKELFAQREGGGLSEQEEAAAGELERDSGLAVHLCEFCEAFCPNDEFRGFVVDGQRTALTAYSPYVYSPALHVARRDELLALLTATWDAAASKVEQHATSYSIDFAVAPDLSRCWVVEINAFLPPLAGSGLFRYAEPADRAALASRERLESTTRAGQAGYTHLTTITCSPEHTQALVAFWEMFLGIHGTEG